MRLAEGADHKMLNSLRHVSKGGGSQNLQTAAVKTDAYLHSGFGQTVTGIALHQCQSPSPYHHTFDRSRCADRTVPPVPGTTRLRHDCPFR